MLIELKIENLLLIERAELSLGEGLNVVTGETGAGKTVLAHAIDLLLGGRSRKGIVRPGASEAYVEGLFRVPEGLLSRPEFSDLRERLSDTHTDELALARRVSPEGRTRAYIEGRSATAADLKLLGGALVAFYGQHEHRKLTLAGAQLSTLDAFAAGVDDRHEGRLLQLGKLHNEANELKVELAELELVDGRRERELGLIEFELAEIEDFSPEAAEERELTVERDKLKAVDALRLAGESALDVFDRDESGSATALLAEAVTHLQSADGADPELEEIAQRADALMIELQDVTADLRHYRDGLSADPERLAAIDDRLDGYERLKRKHGGSVDEVLGHATRCREDRERLSGSQERIEETTARLNAVEVERQKLAKQVTKARKTAAPMLAAAVRERLAALALADASFEIEIVPESGEIRPSGSDVVEFMIAPNPGIAPMPLRETASGGELSRVMLALLSAGAGNGGGEANKLFVFDEVDAGIGGHTARAVGEQLAALGTERQVICITHLPQVAAAAERHFQIEKSNDGEEARTEVRTLGRQAVVDELCRMMGADAGDNGARKHARELLATA